MLGPGRRESAIDKNSPFFEFADGLRDLRWAAELDLQDLADRTGYSRASLSAAAGGRSLPSLKLTKAFVGACGGDPEVWAKLWQELAAPQRDAPDEAGTSGEESASTDSTAGNTSVSPAFPADDTSVPLATLPDEDRFRSGRWACHCVISATSGQEILVREGSLLIFGRGPEVDMIISAGRGLSRRAGTVTVTAAGAWIANISRTHALYIEGDDYRIRLPRMEHDGEPVNGWFVRMGTAQIGSRAMLDDDQPLIVTVRGHYEPARRVGLTEGPGGNGLSNDGSLIDDFPASMARPGRTPTPRFSAASVPVDRRRGVPESDGEGTLLPFYIDPMTKLFLVALLWCRPWLIDPSATRPLPRTPEIARGALEVTGAYRELDRFDGDPQYRDLLSAKVAEHIKVLRRKITDRGLAASNVRVSDEVAVRILIEHGIITSADLGRTDDPAWRSRQEDLWWAQN